jgi:hypothetical protein
MLTGLLFGLVVVAALACPVMVLLGRRGIGPGCAMMGCKPKREQETLESLRARHDELSTRIAKIEGSKRIDEPVGADRA